MKRHSPSLPPGAPPEKRSNYGHYPQAPTFKGCSSIKAYDIQRKLGEGTFGEVYKGVEKATGFVVALKKIIMNNEKEGFPITALREIKLLKLLHHKNVLSLHEMAVEREKDPYKNKVVIHMYMVTPYMDHDLSGLLENPSVKFTEPQIKCYMLQLFEGIKYLHENQILHRDIKAANLLINNKGILKIADFGLARKFDEPPPVPGGGCGKAQREYTNFVVTRWYRPPELLLGERKYTCAVDMWGVGCVFAEMYRGKPILAGNSDLDQAHRIFKLCGSPTETSMPGISNMRGCEGVKVFGPYPRTLENTFADIGSAGVSLLADLLLLDPLKRINAIDALKHEYFRTNPLPATPESLPQFEESHELDRRQNRNQKANLPPAPAGGSVGVVNQNGDWNRPRESGSRPPWAASANAALPRRPHPPPDQSRPSHRPLEVPIHLQRQPPDAARGRDGGERRPAWARDRPNGTPGSSQPPPSRTGDRVPPPRSAQPGVSGGSRPPRPASKDVDSYVPSYDASAHPPRERDRDRDRDIDRHRERDSYRERDRDRDPHRERDRDRDRPRDDRDLHRDRDRDRDYDRDRARDRDRPHDGRPRDRDRDRDRDYERSRDSRDSRERSRERDSWRR